MTGMSTYSVTILCATGGIFVGAILGFINGWARAVHAGDRQEPLWIPGADDGFEAEVIQL